MAKRSLLSRCPSYISVIWNVTPCCLAAVYRNSAPSDTYVFRVQGHKHRKLILVYAVLQLRNKKQAGKFQITKEYVIGYSSWLIGVSVCGVCECML